jgi:hypothetical protein
LVLEMEELWLQTRKCSEAEKRLLAEIKRLQRELDRNLRAAELQLAHVRARIQFPELRVPSKMALVFRALNFRLAKRITYSRADLQLFWAKACQRKSIWMRPDRIALNFLRDVELFLMFVRDLARV